MPILIITNVTVLSTSVYVEWTPAQKELLHFPFREYYVDIVRGIPEPHSQHNFTTNNVSLNITNLQPVTNYSIAVSYSVTDNEGHVIQSRLSDIVNITTLPMCELKCVHTSA